MLAIPLFLCRTNPPWNVFSPAWGSRGPEYITFLCPLGVPNNWNEPAYASTEKVSEFAFCRSRNPGTAKTNVGTMNNKNYLSLLQSCGSKKRAINEDTDSTGITLKTGRALHILPDGRMSAAPAIGGKPIIYYSKFDKDQTFIFVCRRSCLSDSKHFMVNM